MGILGGFYGFKPPSNKCITVIRALTQRPKRTPSSWFLAVYDPACLCNRPNRRNLTLKSFLRCLAACSEGNALSWERKWLQSDARNHCKHTAIYALVSPVSRHGFTFCAWLWSCGMSVSQGKSTCILCFLLVFLFLFVVALLSLSPSPPTLSHPCTKSSIGQGCSVIRCLYLCTVRDEYINKDRGYGFWHSLETEGYLCYSEMLLGIKRSEALLLL